MRRWKTEKRNRGDAWVEKARSDRDGNGRQGERFCQGIHTFNSSPPICRNWICNHIERFLKAIPDQRCRSLQSWKVHGEGKTWILEVDVKKSSEEGQTDRSRLKKLVSPLMWTRIMKRLMKTKSLACSWRRFRNWFKTSTRLGATGGFKVSLHLTCALRNSNCWVDRLTSNFFPRRRRLWSISRMKKMRNAFGGTFSDTSPKLRKTLGEFQIWEAKSKRFLRNWIPNEFERYRLI